MAAKLRIRILLYTHQPFVALGLASALKARREFELTSCCDSLAGALGCLRTAAPNLVLVYPATRIGLPELQELRAAAPGAQLVLWGPGLEGEFAFQAMQLGVRGILPAETPVEGLLVALDNIRRGVLCFEQQVIESVLSQKRVILTLRQGQIVSLVAQGLRNKEIGNALGITEGTVKLYVYKLFRKLGVSDRLSMALYGMKSLTGGEPLLERNSGAVLRPRNASPHFGPRSLPAPVRETAGLLAVN